VFASRRVARRPLCSTETTLITIGRYGVLSLSEARTEAKRLLAEFTLGRVRPQSLTFEEAVKVYLEDRKGEIRPRTLKDYSRQLALFRFKGPLSQITSSEAERRVKLITSPSERQHALVAGRVFWRWAIRKKYTQDNPLSGIPIPKGNRRTRTLNPEELRAVWKATYDPTLRWTVNVLGRPLSTDALSSGSGCL
jgi:integrase